MQSCRRLVDGSNPDKVPGNLFSYLTPLSVKIISSISTKCYALSLDISVSIHTGAPVHLFPHQSVSSWPSLQDTCDLRWFGGMRYHSIINHSHIWKHININSRDIKCRLPCCLVLSKGSFPCRNIPVKCPGGLSKFYRGCISKKSPG